MGFLAGSILPLYYRQSFLFVRDSVRLCYFAPSSQEMRKIKQMLSGKFADQVYCGYWYSPEADYVRFCLEKSQENVEGKVTLNLFKGHVCTTISI